MQLTRRQFAVTAVMSGYAAAARPVRADAIQTDVYGLVAGPVSIPVKDGHIPAYAAKPEGKGPFMTVLVAHEVFGVHEYIQDVCRRFAKLGLFAIAPDLFARAGDVSRIADVKNIIADVVSKVPDAQVMSDLDSTARYALENGGGQDNLGITGFCWGGRIAWLYAAHNQAVKAGVVFYGMVDKAPFGQGRVLDIVSQIHCPMLGLYGGKDSSIPAASLDQLKAKLKEAHVPNQIIIYPDAGHGFFADYRESYNEEASADAWNQCIGWLKTYLQ